MKAVIHHAEIVLKGKNRSFFENKLVKNIKTALKINKIGFENVKRDDNRIIISFKEKNEIKIEQLLENIFGIKYFAFAEESENKLESILKKSREILKKIKKENKRSIALLTKRSDKGFPLTSLELNKKIGEEANKLGIKINFKNPDEIIFIEITSSKAYFYTRKIKGLAGLPVSTSGKVLALLSGGIDSALASWLMMKRGCKVDFLHFHVFKNNKEVLKTKIKPIIERLNYFQFSSKLFLIPYHNYQIETLGKLPGRLDLVIFKNFMLMVAQEIALKYNYKAITTGDSLGQVASQTLNNILATNHNIKLPILRPLISYDKEEIIDLAKKIGTYEESIKQYKDCCSIIARKPATSVKISKLGNELSKLDLDRVIKKNLSEIDIVKFKC